jgi:Family of unknown function (DUF6059)
MTPILRRCLRIALLLVREYGRGQAYLSVAFIIAPDALDHAEPQPTPSPKTEGSDDVADDDAGGVRPVAGHPERLISHVPLSPAERMLWAQLE